MTVPTQKFRSRKTRKSTIGSGVRNSRTISANRAPTEITLNQVIQVLANQSSCLSLVQDDLESGQPNSKQPEADCVDGPRPRVLDVGRVLNVPSPSDIWPVPRWGC